MWRKLGNDQEGDHQSEPEEQGKEQDEKLDEGLPANSKVDADNNKFPYTICWSPYANIVQLVPIAGHVSIGDADGTLHDFNDIFGKGKGTITVGEVSYGKPYKYH